MQETSSDLGVDTAASPALQLRSLLYALLSGGYAPALRCASRGGCVEKNIWRASNPHSLQPVQQTHWVKREGRALIATTIQSVSLAAFM
ncbi:hypothetical protein COCON_G00091760 [Conger conger]|uniref:Uncharacterized protein n=1 Tax=Conger conger TaxID=82655 RepID=A0A9Q1I077_CONCO|nr:hypothetical protein COCON_G00091760 [Conger conger]